MEDIFKKEGYVLLSKYVANHTKVHTKCPEGHDYYVAPAHFTSSKSRCPICGDQDNETTKKKALAAFEKEGYKVLGEYKNARTPVRLLHKDHECEISWARWNIQNVRCPTCFGTPKKKLKDLQQIALKAGFTLFDQEYKGKDHKLKWQCHERNHTFYKPWNSFRGNPTCPKCKTSAPEVEIMEICEKEFGFKYIHRDRKAVKGYEIDISLRSQKIGIEYCGLYWHSQKHKSKNYHFEKWKACWEAGVRLITIFEDEWLFGDGKEKLRKILSGKEIETGKEIDLCWANLTDKTVEKFIKPKKHFIKSQKRCKEKTKHWLWDCGYAIIEDETDLTKTTP